MLRSMADKTKSEIVPFIPPPDVAFAMAYLGAKRELERLVEEEKNITIRKAQLRETMKALGPLVAPELKPDVATMSLADAIRLIIRNAGRPVNALEIRSRLKDLGYNLDQHENPMASIHTALRRMEENDEVTPSEWDGTTKKKFEPGPALKALPDSPPLFDLSALAGLATPGDRARKTLDQTITEGNSESPPETK